jgi:thiamine-monophosphate kinase
VHFRRDWASLADVGWKAAGSALSDLAAAGARPLGVQLALQLPFELEDRSVLELVGGFTGALRSAKAPLVGGNVAARPRGSGLSLSVSVAGAVRHAFTRDGARAGDGLYVSGTPGLARLGFLLLEAGKKAPRRPIERLLRPRPLLALGQELARLRRGRPSAVMDVSDGLARSAGQLAAASGLRAVLEEVTLPLAGLRRFASGHDPLELALVGGEDYELLVAAPPSFDSTRPAASFTRIGTFEKGRGAFLRGEKGSRDLAGLGFSHR